MAALGLVLFINRFRKINIDVLYVTLALASLGIIPVFYWVQPKLIGLLAYFVLSIWTIGILAKAEIEVVINILSKLIVIILIGACIGTLYAYFGGMPLLGFANPDGRLNQVYLTTLTNLQFDNFIRPAGIFDEPGALSFLICFIAALRHATRRDKKITWSLLILGFITMSVAHLLYVTFHALQEWKDASVKKVPLFVVITSALLLFVVLLLPPIQDLFHTLFITRFGSGQLGDDRLGMFNNAVSYLNIHTFFFGLDSDCAAGLASCADKGYANYGDNPLTLLIHWGLLLSLPYYFVMGYLVVRSIKQCNFIIFGIFLLLLQRPYVMSFGYSMLIMLTIFVLGSEKFSQGFREKFNCALEKI